MAATLLIDAARGKPLPQGWINTGYTLITKQNVAAITKANAIECRNGLLLVAEGTGHRQPPFGPHPTVEGGLGRDE